MIIEMRNGIGLTTTKVWWACEAAQPSDVSGAGAIAQAVVTPEIAITKNIRQVGYAGIICRVLVKWRNCYWSGPYVGKNSAKTGGLGFSPQTVGNVPVVDRTMEP